MVSMITMSSMRRGVVLIMRRMDKVAIVGMMRPSFGSGFGYRC